jgi:predicted transcriptional regulator
MPKGSVTRAAHATARARALAASRTVLTCVRRGSREQPAIARGLAALAAAGERSPFPLVDGEHDEAVPHRHTYRAVSS